MEEISVFWIAVNFIACSDVNLIGRSPKRDKGRATPQERQAHVFALILEKV
jgi:hypothetical protein